MIEGGIVREAGKEEAGKEISRVVGSGRKRKKEKHCVLFFN